MNWLKIKGLKEERAQLLADMKAMLTTSETEKRDLTAEENTKFDELNKRADDLKGTIDRWEAAHRLDTELAPKQEQRQQVGREDINTPGSQADESATESREAFNEFCRTGEIRATNTITTTTGSGAYVPKQVVGIESVAKLGNSLKAALAFYSVPAIPVSGKVSISVPVIDLSDGSTVDGDEDTEQLATSSDASVTLNVTTYNSKPQWLDNGIVTAQAYDAAGSLVPVLRVACERGQEAAFYAASITTAGLKAAARETATASEVLFSDLSGLLFDLGGYAVGRCAYLVSMSMLAAMHSMADDNGRPVNKLTKDAGQFYWDGVPVFPTTALEAIADGKYVAAAINVDACRCAESQPWVQRYDQNSARPNQVGYDYLQYAACGIKSNAVKLLKVKAAA